MTQPELEEKYAQYKQDYARKTCEKYFETHKDQEWQEIMINDSRFMEKYQMEHSKPIKEMVASRRSELLASFEENLNQGKYDVLFLINYMQDGEF